MAWIFFESTIAVKFSGNLPGYPTFCSSAHSPKIAAYQWLCWSWPGTVTIFQPRIHLKRGTALKYQFIYSCNICGKQILTEIKLKQHQDAAHKSKGFQCTKCDQRVKSKSSLSQLIGAFHEGVKYPCRQCDHTATSKGHLARHKRAVHEGVRYPCRQCDHMETSEGHLGQHKIALHKWVKYPCSLAEHKRWVY